MENILRRATHLITEPCSQRAGFVHLHVSAALLSDISTGFVSLKLDSVEAVLRVVARHARLLSSGLDSALFRG